MDILTINKANCKDCYKCVRYCPVNAIKVTDGHAHVDPDRCILDGQCYKICPQKAKSVRNDIELAKLVIKQNKYVVASIAPSFFAYYKEPLRSKMLKALIYLGFDSFEQTSRAADTVAMAHIEHYKKTNDVTITSSCPASVSLIEKYYPDLIKYLAPVVSPAIAHYKLLENEIKTPFKMIFIGPCIAKKKELEETPIAASLTFEELEEWIKEEEIDVESLETYLPEKYSQSISALFPLLGGLIKTAGLDDSNLSKDLISVNGVENIQDLLESIRAGKVESKFVEVLACEGGCIMGPVRPKDAQNSTFYELRNNLIETFSEISNLQKADKLPTKLLNKIYSDKSLNLVEPTEEEIKKVLASIGKTEPQDELNCGTCGYDSCREKAKAVLQGMAEKEMCIPYMKSMAERFSTVVIENTPNSVVILDYDLNIVQTNPAFLNLFDVTKNEIIDKHISFLTPEEPFKEALNRPDLIMETCTLYKEKKLKRIIFSLPDQKLLTSIFVDITDEEANRAALIKVKKETLDRAQKVIDKQMRVAQEIAGILGETTAETKVLLGQLVKILQQE